MKHIKHKHYKGNIALVDIFLEYFIIDELDLKTSYLDDVVENASYMYNKVNEERIIRYRDYLIIVRPDKDVGGYHVDIYK